VQQTPPTVVVAMDAWSGGCETCGASVAPRLKAFHREWHATEDAVSARPEFVADLRSRLMATATANDFSTPPTGDRCRRASDTDSRRLGPHEGLLSFTRSRASIDQSSQDSRPGSRLDRAVHQALAPHIHYQIVGARRRFACSADLCRKINQDKCPRWCCEIWDGQVSLDSRGA